MVEGDDGSGDHLARAELPRAGLQVTAAVTTNVCDEARRRHNCASTATEVLSEAITATVLLSAALEDLDRLTLQWVGSGPMGGVIVDAAADGTVRGYVQNSAVRLWGSGGRVAALGAGGVLNAVREREGRRTNGSVERAGGTIADDVIHYLSQSEKRPSALVLDVRLDRQGSVLAAAGLLVEPARRPPRDLGGDDGAELAVAAGRAVLDSVGGPRLLARWGGGPLRAADLAAQALAPLAAQMHALHQRTLSFGCRCSREKVERMLAALGTQELAEMIEKDGKGEVVCEFCARRYDFTREELLVIIRTLVTGRAN
jgi:molecular chaperone Hsp33